MGYKGNYRKAEYRVGHWGFISSTCIQTSQLVTSYNCDSFSLKPKLNSQLSKTQTVHKLKRFGIIMMTYYDSA